MADILTFTANNSAQTLTDLFEALKLVGPTAQQAGASLESTAASLGVLANLGLRGSLAGTALRRVFQQLANTDIRSRLENQLNIEIGDTEFANLPDTIARIVRATSNLSNVERAGVITQLFGARAAGAAAALGES